MAQQEINVFLRGVTEDSKEVKAMACLAPNGADMALVLNEGPRILVIKKHGFSWDGDKLAPTDVVAYKFPAETLIDREADTVVAGKDKLTLVFTDGESAEALAVVDEAQTKRSLVFKQNMLPAINAAKTEISVTVGEGGAIAYADEKGGQFEAKLPALLFSYNVGQTATVKTGRNGQLIVWDRYDGQHVIGATQVAGAAVPAEAPAPAAEEAAAPAEAKPEEAEGVLEAEAEDVTPPEQATEPASKPAAEGVEMCDAKSPDGRCCTKAKGHDKKHWFGGTAIAKPAAPAAAAADTAEEPAAEAAAEEPAAEEPAPAAKPAKAPVLPAANNGEVSAATVLAKLNSLEQAFGSAIRDIKLTVKTLDAQKGADAKQLAELRKQLKMIAGALG